MFQCWEMLTDDMLLSNYIVSGSPPRFFHNLDVKVQEAVRLLLKVDIEGNELIVTAKSISIDNICYFIKAVYVLQTVVPVFLKVIYIVCLHDCWLLCGHLLTPNCFSYRLHSYQVLDENDWMACKTGCFIDFNRHDYFKFNNCQYVNMSMN